MTIKLIQRESEGELLLEGRLDATTAPEAEEIFLQMTQRFEKLTLNMDQLRYISSAGLRVLKKTYMAMVKKGGYTGFMKADAVEALRIYNGKPMINSVNGKQESMDAVFPLAKKYGGAEDASFVNGVLGTLARA